MASIPIDCPTVVPGGSTKSGWGTSRTCRSGAGGGFWRWSWTSARAGCWRGPWRRDAQLTCRVLDAAVRRRQPPRGLIFHSDRGSEYVAAVLRDRLRALGIQQSSARRGPEDNAHMESFFHSLKAEVVHGTRYATDEALRQDLARYFRYYNHRRRHSALGYRSPVDYEACAA